MPVVTANLKTQMIELKLFSEDNMTFYTTAEGAIAFARLLIAAAAELEKQKAVVDQKEAK